MKVSLVQVEKPKRGKRVKKEELITDPIAEGDITSTVTPAGDKKKKLNITDHVKQYAPGGAEMTFEPEKDKAAEMRGELEKAIEKDAYQETSAAIESSQNPVPAALQAPFLNGTYDEAILESALNRIIQKNKMLEKEKYMELKKKSLEKIASLLGVQSSFSDSDITSTTIGANITGGTTGQGPMAGTSTAIGDGIEEPSKPQAESESTAPGGSAPIPSIPSAPTPKPSKKPTPTEEYVDDRRPGAFPYGVFGVGFGF